MAQNDRDDDPFDDATDPVEDVEDEPSIEDLEVEGPDIEDPEDAGGKTSDEVGKTPASIAVATESPDRRAELLDLAHRLDVRPDDPAWLLVRAALDAQGAASVTTEAIAKLDEAPASIEKAALDGAGNAAAEIKQHAASGARAVIETMSAEIEKAAAIPVARAMRPHIKAISDQAGEIAKTLRITENERIHASAEQFMDRVTRQIDSRSIASKTSGRVSAMLLLVLGAALGVAGVKLDHRLAPAPIRSATGGGYTIAIPSGYTAQLGNCSGTGCVYVHPTKQRQGGGGK